MQVLREQRLIEAELVTQRHELVGRGGVAEYLLRGIARQRLRGDEDENRDAEQDRGR